MVELDGGSETYADLCAEMRRKHIWARRRQIVRWQAADLLPRPRQRGLGNGRGSETLYPPGTSKQLVALIRLKRTTRSLSALRFELWWRGFNVPTATVLAEFTRVAKQVPAAAQQLRDPGLVLPTRLPKSSGQTRRRVGTAMFPTLMRIFGEVLTGEFTDFAVDRFDNKNVEALAVERALDLKSAESDRLLDAEPWLPSGEDVGALLGSFSAALAPLVDNLLSGVSQEELVRRRDILRRLEDLLIQFHQSSAAIVGPRPTYALALLGALLEIRDRSTRIGMLLVWPAVEAFVGADLDRKLQEILRAGSSMPSRRDVATLRAIRAGVPEIDVLLGRRAAKAIRSRTEWDRLQEDIGEAAKRHRRRIEAIVRSVARKRDREGVDELLAPV